jgi:ankyrin repeat protein
VKLKRGFAMQMQELASERSTIKKLIIMFTLFLTISSGLAGAQDKDETFIYAAVEGDQKKVEAFLNEGANVNAKGKESNRTALMWASLRGHLDVVRLLLERRADVNARDDNGETALLSASGKGGIGVVKLLLDKGADINARDKNGRNALMTPSWLGQSDVVKLLLEKGIDVNASDKTGRTALLWASEQGHTEVAELLKSYGATQ